MGCDQWTKPDTTLQTISIHAPQWGATSRRCPCSHRRNDFNPRTPVGCDVQLMLLVKWATKFQSTHPSGVRPGGDREKTISALFQSTHPSGVRPVEYRIGDTVKPFQSTHPSGVRLPSHPCRRTFHVFQSTHPSGVRHGGVRRHTGELYISIHAPQWGATTEATVCPSTAEFQSTHPSGVRRTTSPGTAQVIYFNPRTPVGCDGNCPIVVALGEISIHAPQWGATRTERRAEPSRGHFNPRTPVGCDMYMFTIPCVIHISIHAPQWGATTKRRGFDDSLSISIHAPQWGAT